ncbi:hypothetical protein Taro_021831 [Colocasia esculenta]|uniref:Uncharacterized protein n=1 Tax=Colocasia esculenta TaxID=4460 RepID=A0A843V003_COLES|nr:hypothetical protein [Colocasia esculenta]
MMATWSDEDEDKGAQDSSDDEEIQFLMARSEDSNEEQWLKSLASTSTVAKFISQDIDDQIHCRLLPFPTEPVTSEAHPYPLRLRPVRGRRTRIKYVIDLTGLAEVFRHSWYQSKKFLEWLIEEIGVVEEMIRTKALSV